MDSNNFTRSLKLLDLYQRFRRSNSVANEYSTNAESVRIKRSNRAAVLICLYEEEDDIYVILTKRSSKLSSYSGEVSLPGGRTDEDDTDDIRTALREAEEEIGLDPALVDVVTVLEPFVTKSNLTVVPVIGILWDKRTFSPIPNVAEVESIFYAPLKMFLRVCSSPPSSADFLVEVAKWVGWAHGITSENRVVWATQNENRQQEEKEFQGDKYLLHYFYHGTNNKEYVIWSLTAGILITAASLVFQRPPDFQPRMPKFWNKNCSKF